MTAGALIALVWALVAVIGAMGGLAFVLGTRGAGLALAFAVLAFGVPGETWAQSNRPSVAYSAAGGRVAGGAITTASPSDFQRLIQAGSNGSVNIADKALVRVGTNPEFEMLLKRPIVSAALMRGAAVALRTLPYVSTGYAIWQMFNETGISPDGNGGLLKDSGIPPGQAEGYVYRVGGNPPASTPEGACANIALQEDGVFAWRYAGSLDGYPPSTYGYCQGFGHSFAWQEKYWGVAVAGISREMGISQYCPGFDGRSTGEMMGNGKCRTSKGMRSPISADAAAQHALDFPGFQAPDPVGLVPQILDRGVDLAPYATGPGTLSGGSTAPGPAETVTTTPAPTPENPNPAPVTTTTNTTINITYTNNTWNQTTNTTTTNPDGSTTVKEGDKETVTPPADPDLPPVPDLYEQKYPDGFAGVWGSKSAALQQTPIFTFLAGLVPSTGDGGCPVWTVPTMYGWGDVRDADVSLPCWLWAVLRTIVVISALLTCRKIIFGG